MHRSDRGAETPLPFLAAGRGGMSKRQLANVACTALRVRLARLETASSLEHGRQEQGSGSRLIPAECADCAEGA